MAATKTKPSKASVDALLDAIENETKRGDSKKIALMAR